MPAAELGPVGRLVADNIRRLRKGSGVSLRDLEARLTELGRPIAANGLMKIEHERRRVDADDLVSIAKALNVPPTRLLLTDEQWQLREQDVLKRLDRIERVLADVADVVA
jgi:transcriptional regulator with XRE-family HTH domain